MLLPPLFLPQEGITIADCSHPDMPLIYANAGFARTTGYSINYTIGKNCRFLQGEGTDSTPVQELKQAISEGRACVVQVWQGRSAWTPLMRFVGCAAGCCVQRLVPPAGRDQRGRRSVAAYLYM